MADKDKRIPKEEQKHFERCLFENDFFDVSAPDEEEQEQPVEDGPQEVEKAITEEDLAQAESRGYTQGLAEGKKQASEDYQAELKTHISQLSDSLKDVDAARAEIIEDAKVKALALLEVIADSLLADAREKYPSELLKNAVGVITQLTDSQKKELKIAVAPQTREFMTETLLKKGKVTGIDEGTFKEDPNLAPGDCIIEWVDGGTDLRLDSLKDDIITALQGAAKSSPAPQVTAEKDTAPETKEVDETEAPDQQPDESAPTPDENNKEPDEADGK